MSDTRTDIVVVGAGMVGAALALTLHQRLPHLSITLVAPDFSPAPDSEAFDPRVVALTQASQELLSELGLWPSLVAQRVCPYRRMHVWDGEGSGQINFDAAQLGRDALGHIVENRLIVAGLIEAIERSGIDCVPGRVEALVSDRDRVQGVVLDTGTSVCAPLTLAADGARSPVRALADLAVRQWSYQQSAIVTTVQTEQPHDFTARQRFMSTGPLAFLPLRQTPDEIRPHHCSIVWSADQPLADSLMALDEEAFARRLTRDFENRLGAVSSVARRYALPLHQRHAKRYVRPGLALVGDAAHSIHPLAGQGVNLGFLDVVALSREIARGHERGLALGEFATLRRYERERMGHNLAVMATMEGFKRLFGSDSLGLLWLRNRGMSRINQLSALKNRLASEAMGLAL